MAKQKKWIQKAHIKGGALHKQLSISENKRIPATLLRKINKTEAGKTIHNPTKTGHTKYKVTTLMKRRANFALNVRKQKK